MISFSPRPRTVMPLLALFSLLSTGCAALPFNPFSDPRYDPTAARDQYRSMLDQQAGTRERPHGGGDSVAQKLHEGDRYSQRGDLQRSVVSYFEAARLDPDAIEPRLRLAHLQIRANPAHAERSFNLIIEERPEEASAWYGLGLARLAQAKLDAARAALDRAIELSPESARFHATLGTVHDRLGQRDLARKSLERAIELHPDGVTPLNNLGVSHLLEGNLAEAEALFRRGLEIEPADPGLLNNLGLAVGLQQRYGEAETIFRRTGDEQSATNNLGYVYYLSGRPEEAVASYERALVAEGSNPITVLRNLRRAQEALERAESEPAP